MKSKSLIVMLAAMLLISACAPAAPAAEPALAEEEMMAESAPESEMEADEAANITEMDSAEDMTAEVSFSQDVWPIFEEYALAAHGGKGGVFLESYTDIMNYVTPGDPENSMLYKALIGDGVKQMPPDAPLPDEMIQTIYDWIQQGAQDN